MQKKTCKVCKVKFEPERNFQACCNYECAMEYARKQSDKKVKSIKSANRKALKKFNDSDINKVKRKAQFTFNKFIRTRDRGKACISCGCYIKDGEGHASHYKPATNSKLRFNENNVHLSCVKCNVFLSGNLVEYRARLIELIGEEEVEYLDTVDPIYKYTIDELNEIIETYKEKTNQLLKK